MSHQSHVAYIVACVVNSCSAYSFSSEIMFFFELQCSIIIILCIHSTNQDRKKREVEGRLPLLTDNRQDFPGSAVSERNEASNLHYISGLCNI